MGFLNRVMVVNADFKETFNNKKFLKFKPLCLVPIQANLCVKEMMNEKEKKWLKEYNRLCYETMKPLIQDRSVLEWLEKQMKMTEQL